MWLYGDASVVVRTIDSAKVRTPKKHVSPIATSAANLGNGQLTFGPRELAEAMVRSSLSRDPTAVDSLMLGLGNWLRLQRAVTRVGGESLRFVEGYRSALRDSALTSLSGELGQAVTYLVARKHFGKRHVVDFGHACSRVGAVPPTVNDTRPDFAGTDNAFASLDLFESKGTIPARGATVDWKDSLRDALGQIDAGVTRLAPTPVDRGWAVTVALRCEADAEPSEIAVADPEGDGGIELPPDRRRALVDLHYAAWLTTVGALQAARLLARAAPEGEAALRGLVLEFAGRQWFVPLWNEPRLFHHLCLPWSARSQDPEWPLRAIEFELVQRLSRGDFLGEDYDWPVELTEELEGEGPEGVVFNDGTAVIRRPIDEPPWVVDELELQFVRGPGGNQPR